MGRKEDADAAKKKQIQKEEVLDLPLETEISILLQYVKNMPMSIRAQFLPGLNQIVETSQISEHFRSIILELVSSCNMEPFDATRKKFIIDIYCKFLKLNKLQAAFNDCQRKKNIK